LMGDLFILYVSHQPRARDFYAIALNTAPTIDTPGMTEFPLPGGGSLGLMPESGIHQLLKKGGLPDPSKADGIPRAEIYLRVADPAAAHARALSAGARELQKLTLMDWADEVAYCLDPFGHVLAFARTK